MDQKKKQYVYKGHSNDGTLLQLTPASVFKYGSVTRYWGGTVTRCYYMDRLRNKKINNYKKKHGSKSEDESATEIVETWVCNGWLLGWPDRLGYWILENSFMSWLKAQWKTESDYVYCPVVWKWLHRAFHECLPQNFDWFVSIKVFY